MISPIENANAASPFPPPFRFHTLLSLVILSLALLLLSTTLYYTAAAAFLLISLAPASQSTVALVRVECPPSRGEQQSGAVNVSCVAMLTVRSRARTAVAVRDATGVVSSGLGGSALTHLAVAPGGVVIGADASTELTASFDLHTPELRAWLQRALDVALGRRPGAAPDASLSVLAGAIVSSPLLAPLAFRVTLTGTADPGDTTADPGAGAASITPSGAAGGVVAPPLIARAMYSGASLADAISQPPLLPAGVANGTSALLATLASSAVSLGVHAVGVWFPRSPRAPFGAAAAPEAGESSAPPCSLAVPHSDVDATARGETWLLRALGTAPFSGSGAVSALSVLACRAQPESSAAADASLACAIAAAPDAGTPRSRAALASRVRAAPLYAGGSVCNGSALPAALAVSLVVGDDAAVAGGGAAATASIGLDAGLSSATLLVQVPPGRASAARAALRALLFAAPSPDTSLACSPGALLVSTASVPSAGGASWGPLAALSSLVSGLELCVAPPFRSAVVAASDHVAVLDATSAAAVAYDLPPPRPCTAPASLRLGMSDELIGVRTAAVTLTGQERSVVQRRVEERRGEQQRVEQRRVEQQRVEEAHPWVEAASQARETLLPVLGQREHDAAGGDAAEGDVTWGDAPGEGRLLLGGLLPSAGGSSFGGLLSNALNALVGSASVISVDQLATVAVPAASDPAVEPCARVLSLDLAAAAAGPGCRAGQACSLGRAVAVRATLTLASATLRTLQWAELPEDTGAQPLFTPTLLLRAPALARVSDGAAAPSALHINVTVPLVAALEACVVRLGPDLDLTAGGQPRFGAVVVATLVPQTLPAATPGDLQLRSLLDVVLHGASLPPDLAGAQPAQEGGDAPVGAGIVFAALTSALLGLRLEGTLAPHAAAASALTLQATRAAAAPPSAAPPPVFAVDPSAAPTEPAWHALVSGASFDVGLPPADSSQGASAADLGPVALPWLALRAAHAEASAPLSPLPPIWRGAVTLPDAGLTAVAPVLITGGTAAFSVLPRVVDAAADTLYHAGRRRRVDAAAVQSPSDALAVACASIAAAAADPACAGGARAAAAASSSAPLSCAFPVPRDTCLAAGLLELGDALIPLPQPVSRATLACLTAARAACREWGYSPLTLELATTFAVPAIYARISSADIGPLTGSVRLHDGGEGGWRHAAVLTLDVSQVQTLFSVTLHPSVALQLWPLSPVNAPVGGGGGGEGGLLRPFPSSRERLLGMLLARAPLPDAAALIGCHKATLDLDVPLRYGGDGGALPGTVGIALPLWSTDDVVIPIAAAAAACGRETSGEGGGDPAPATAALSAGAAASVQVMRVDGTAPGQHVALSHGAVRLHLVSGRACNAAHAAATGAPSGTGTFGPLLCAGVAFLNALPAPVTLSWHSPPHFAALVAALQEAAAAGVAAPAAGVAAAAVVLRPLLSAFVPASISYGAAATLTPALQHDVLVSPRAASTPPARSSLTPQPRLLAARSCWQLSAAAALGNGTSASGTAWGCNTASPATSIDVSDVAAALGLDRDELWARVQQGDAAYTLLPLVVASVASTDPRAAFDAPAALAAAVAVPSAAQSPPVVLATLLPSRLAASDESGRVGGEGGLSASPVHVLSGTVLATVNDLPPLLLRAAPLDLNGTLLCAALYPIVAPRSAVLSPVGSQAPTTPATPLPTACAAPAALPRAASPSLAVTFAVSYSLTPESIAFVAVLALLDAALLLWSCRRYDCPRRCSSAQKRAGARCSIRYKLVLEAPSTQRAAPPAATHAPGADSELEAAALVIRVTDAWGERRAVGAAAL